MSKMTAIYSESMDLKQREANRLKAGRFRRISKYRADFLSCWFSKIGVSEISIIERPNKGSTEMENYYRHLDELVDTYFNRYFNIRFNRENVSYFHL